MDITKEEEFLYSNDGIYLLYKAWSNGNCIYIR